MLLEGKVIWITGASRGIGRATACVLAREGAALVISARTSDSLLPVVEVVTAAGNPAPLCLAYDVADQQQVKNAFATVNKQFGRLDAIVNNAGILEEGLLGMTTMESVQRQFSINTFAVIQHTQLAARLMMRNKAGSIINLSSIAGTVGRAGLSVYAATKAAIAGFTRSAAKELAPHGIRVNALAPGLIATDMAAVMSQEKLQERVNSIKMQRIGTAAEVAGAVLFLASDLSSYVTGQVIGVDGGMVE